MTIEPANLRLICARIGDTRVSYREEHAPVVRTCARCGHKVLATQTALRRMGPHGAFVIMCLECHHADPGQKLLFNTDGQLLGHVPARPEKEPTMHDQPMAESDGTSRA